MNHDIIICTFKERFDMFKELVKSIRKYNTESKIIIGVNGEIDKEFDEMYRAHLYDFLKDIPKTYLRIWTEFRGLSKMINDCIISSTTDYVLYMSDDALVLSEKFFEDVEKGIEKYQGIFRLGGSGCFIVFNRKEMHQLGYYDERLLTIGKEDVDIAVKYRSMYGQDKEIPLLESVHVKNFNCDIVQSGFQQGSYRKYPALNMILIHTILNNPDERFAQYPYEWFYRVNKNQIKQHTKIENVFKEKL